MPGAIGDVVSTILQPATNRARIIDLAYGGFQPDPAKPGTLQAVPNAMYVARGRELFAQCACEPGAVFGKPFKPGELFNFVRRTPLDTTVAGPDKPNLINGRAIRGIAVDPADWHHAFIIDFAQVFETTDAGLNWIELGQPVGSPATRSIEVVPNKTTGKLTIILGTSFGVYAANDTGTINVNWHELGVGVPSVIVSDIVDNKKDDRLVIATAGRGVWSLDGAGNSGSPIFVGAIPKLVVTGDLAGPTNDQFVVRRNPNNPRLMQVFINPTVGGFVADYA